MRTESIPTALDRHTIDAQQFRETLGHFASGITVIAGTADAEPVGFTCQSFSSLSASPPLVLFSVMNTSTSYPKIRRAGRFSINVLAHSQTDISSQFARKGIDKWSGVNWHLSEHGNPIIADTQMWLECELFAEYDGGDHTIVVGKVLELSPSDWHQGNPLLFFRGQYRHLLELEEAAHA